MTTTPAEELLTIEEVAKLLKVKPSWLYTAAQRGDVPRVKVGKFVRFRESELNAWLANGGTVHRVRAVHRYSA